MSRTPITPSRSFQIRTNGLFKKGNTLFNLLQPKVVVFIQPSGATIPGCEEALAYASHRKEEWPELYEFFESAGVRPQNICGPDDFDTVAARRSVAPTDRAPAPSNPPSEPHRGSPFPELPSMSHQTNFLRSAPESHSSDSCRETPFPEMAPMPHQANLLRSGYESQSSESLRVTPVPENHHTVYGRTAPVTEQAIDESLLSLLNEPEHELGEIQFEPQTRPRATQGVEQRTKALGRPDNDGLGWSRDGTPLPTNKRKAVPDAEGMRKRRSMAGSEDRDRRRKMMTRSQGRGPSFYS
ncbi:hypothetical protein EDB80DRAFT_717298, partial [Ilyonectria destructans]